MIKDYFIAFDYFNNRYNFNKFYYGIITVDLEKEKLRKFCKQIVKDNNPELMEIAFNSMEIKVTALNNIDTK